MLAVGALANAHVFFGAAARGRIAGSCNNHRTAILGPLQRGVEIARVHPVSTEEYGDEPARRPLESTLDML